MNRRRLLAVAGTAGLGGLTGCLDALSGGDADRRFPTAPTGEWNQHAHDGQNTGATGGTIPPRGNPVWTGGSALQAAPVVGGETVFSTEETATATDARTGRQLWSTALPADGAVTEAEPALTDDRLLVAVETGLIALDRADGTERWSTSLPAPVSGPVSVAPDGDLAVVPTYVGMAAYDTRTGRRLWTDRNAATDRTRRVAVADRIYALAEPADGRWSLRALTRAGTTAWEVDLHATEPGLYAAPVLAEGVGPDGRAVLVPEGDSLAVRRPVDGSRRRRLGPFDGGVRGVPAVANGTAFVPSDRETVAISLADGTERWRADVEAFPKPGLAVADDAVVVGAASVPGESLPAVAALDRADGTVRWSHVVERFDPVISAVVPADGAVFAVTNNSNDVLALGDVGTDGG